MARDGEGVSVPNQLPLGGAEPLSHSQMSVGHQSDDRPSRIYERFQNIAADDYDNQEEIAIADDRRRRPAEKEIRSGPGGKGRL